MNEQFQNRVALILWLLLCLTTQFLSAYFTFSSVQIWYPTLVKPSWTPPGWVFGPVWTCLYLSMGISAWLIWRERRRTSVFYPLLLFCIQLIWNCLWSILFFGCRNIEYAFYDIVLLWLSILCTILAFGKVRRYIGAILIPYFLWVSYAAILNFAVWRLNS